MFRKKLINISLVCIAFLTINSYGNSLNTWWSSSPLDNGSIYDVLRPLKAKNDIFLRTPQNYLIHAALMIRNTGKKLVAIKIALSNKTLQNNIIIRDTVSIRSRGKVLFADILPELFPEGLLLIPVGETRQLFLEINTKGLNQGIYDTKVNLINVDNSLFTTANIKLDVTSLRLPKEPTMDMLVWDCSLRQIKDKKYAEKLAKVLGEAGVNAFHVLEKVDIKFNQNLTSC